MLVRFAVQANMEFEFECYFKIQMSKSLNFKCFFIANVWTHVGQTKKVVKANRTNMLVCIVGRFVRLIRGTGVRPFFYGFLRRSLYGRSFAESNSRNEVRHKCRINVIFGLYTKNYRTFAKA